MGCFRLLDSRFLHRCFHCMGSLVYPTADSRTKLHYAHPPNRGCRTTASVIYRRVFEPGQAAPLGAVATLAGPVGPVSRRLRAPGLPSEKTGLSRRSLDPPTRPRPGVRGTCGGILNTATPGQPGFFLWYQKSSGQASKGKKECSGSDSRYHRNDGACSKWQSKT
jgi:hypothetical protein